LRCTQVLTGFALGITLVLLACPPVLAGPPTDRLRDFFAEVNAILADPMVQERPLEGVARVRPLVAELSDVGAAAAAALGPRWYAQTPAEREEFTDLFAELLERAYVGRLAGTARLTDGMQVLFLDEILADGEATVVTAIGARYGRDVVVEYRMANRHGRWLVRDVVLDGVSIVANYYAQFKRLLHRGSYAELVSRLQAKLEEKSLIFARAEPRVPAAMPAVVTLLEVKIVASRPTAARAVPPRPPDAVEIARPVAVPPSPVDAAPVQTTADSTGFLFWALFLGLLGVAGAAYFRKRTRGNSALAAKSGL
jgi:phospholipid transport system substrate-binding protein